MKDTWKNNLGLKIAAAFIAVFLWWTVVNVDDPMQTKNYTTDVILTNTDVVTNAGKSYQIVGSSRSITITLKARRKVLGEIKQRDIIATADFREMNEQTQLVPIRVEINRFKDENVEASVNPRNLQIKTELTETKTFPIAVATMGEVRDGYVLDKTNTVASPALIEISGPKSSLGRINRVIAKVDVSELSQDTTLQGELIYYDSADNIVDKNQLSSNCDKNGVTVDVKLLSIKSLELRFNTSEIKTGEGYVLTGIEVEPKTIRIAGKKEELKQLAYLDVAADALKKDGLIGSEEVVVDISEYLPENIILADETAGSVAVKILIEKAGTKTVNVPVGSIKVNNLSEGFEIAYESAQSVELKFSGTQEGLEKLTIENIIPVIDMAQYKEGTYKISVQVLDLPEQCSYLGGATIDITVKKK